MGLVCILYIGIYSDESSLSVKWSHSKTVLALPPSHSGSISTNILNLTLSLPQSQLPTAIKTFWRAPSPSKCVQTRPNNTASTHTTTGALSWSKLMKILCERQPAIFTQKLGLSGQLQLPPHRTERGWAHSQLLFPRRRTTTSVWSPSIPSPTYRRQTQTNLSGSCRETQNTFLLPVDHPTNRRRRRRRRRPRRLEIHTKVSEFDTVLQTTFCSLAGHDAAGVDEGRMLLVCLSLSKKMWSGMLPSSRGITVEGNLVASAFSWHHAEVVI